MAAKLKPLRKEEDLALIPVDQPVLVELEPGASSLVEDEADDKPDDQQLRHAERREEGEGEDPAIKTLKDQMAAQKAAQDAENERLRKEAREARERAETAERQAKEARTEVVDAETAAIESGLAAAQRERDAAKLAVKQAFESGDADKLADAQERLGRAAAEIRDFERSAAALADNKKQAERAAQEPPKRQDGPVDVVAAIDSNPNLMPAEKTWLKEHQDAVIDPGRNNELGVAYTHATRQGLIRGTEPYFRFIEKFMGYTKGDDAVVIEDNEERPGIVSAPVSRDSRSPSGQPTNTRVHLTPEQRDLARSMGLSDVEYARGVVAMSADKKANPEKYFRS